MLPPPRLICEEDDAYRSRRTGAVMLWSVVVHWARRRKQYAEL